ncbi:MAG: type II toxin-antitoxin system HicB family antitoxin [Synergistaceae bacterium]|jgi:predicted RNase H-like HicB family nuclease|nr:type II toxin-antitoxin system HicB family antitoxin [Synergistaceae bacterium]
MNAVYTVRYTKTESGYTGQLVEWPAVISEGVTLEECRDMVIDAAREMTIAYREQGMQIPEESNVIDHIMKSSALEAETRRRYNLKKGGG